MKSEKTSIAGSQAIVGKELVVGCETSSVGSGNKTL
jgi:hypothetical protein